MTTQPVSKEVADLLSAYAPAVRSLALAARSFAFKMIPDISEEVDAKARIIGYAYGPKYTDMVCMLMRRTPSPMPPLSILVRRGPSGPEAADQCGRAGARIPQRRTQDLGTHWRSTASVFLCIVDSLLISGRDERNAVAPMRWTYARISFNPSSTRASSSSEALASRAPIRSRESVRI